MIVNANKGLNAGLAPYAGWLMAAVSLLAAVEAFGLLRRDWLYLWPGLLLAGGLAAGVSAALAARKGGLAEARLRLAATVAALLAAGGLGEVLRAAGALPGPMSFVWPLCLLILGGLAMQAAAQRRAGALMMLAGAMRGFEAAFGVQPGAVGTGWFVVLFVAAVMLLRAARPPAPGGDR